MGNRAYGTPTPSQLEKINALAKRPLSVEDVFVFPGKALGDGLIPTRLYRAHKSLLEVFRGDAQKGVALMIDHPWAGWFSPKPAYVHGRTFDALLKKTMDNSLTDETWGLFVDHYIVRGREIDGVKSDQLIAGIEDGTIFDTSVGFGNDKYECSICHGDYTDYEKCKHFRGEEYEGEICHIILKPPGFLMENSLVFDGAYPGAGALSAMGDPSKPENYLDPVEDLKGFKEGTRFLHTFSDSRGAMNTFVLREPIKGIVVPDIRGLAITGTDMAKLQTQTQTQGKEDVNTLNKESQVFAAVLAAAGIATVTEDMTADQIMAAFTVKTTESIKLTIRESAAPLQFALTEPDIRRALGLTEQADQPIPENWSTKIVQFTQEGRESRQELITDTLEWGVRAHGNDFAMESYREILSESGRTVQAIKDMREQFKKKAGEELATGRATKIQTGTGKAQSNIPAEAFKV